MSGKIPVRIVTDGDGTIQRVGIDFGANHNFEVVTAADARSGGHIAMTQAVATALGISVGSLTGFIIDDYPGASFAYSARKIRQAQTFCMRVRVSGVGTYGSPVSEYDVTAEVGGITTATPVTYAGVGTAGATTMANLLTAGGNNDITITTLYDQSGNGRDVTQATAANQPFIALAGNLYILNTGKPASPYAAGSGRFLARAAVPVAEMFGSGTDFTFFSVSRATSYASTFCYHGWGTGSANNLSLGNVANTLYLDPPETSARALAAFSATTEQQWAGWRSGGTVTLLRNAGAFASNGAATGSGSGSATFRYLGSGNQFTAAQGALDTYLGEHIHYASKIADASITAISAEQKAFWGTP